MKLQYYTQYSFILGRYSFEQFYIYFYFLVWMGGGLGEKNVILYMGMNNLFQGFF